MVYSPSSFTNTVCRETERRILTDLREHGTKLVADISINSPRAVGDAIQEYLAENIQHLLPAEVLKQIETGFQRRSMEDMAFYDRNEHYYAVDVKTHNELTAFNMPNLISVKRLSTFYTNDTNHFFLLVVKYRPEGDTLHYTECLFLPIEHLDWQCLTIGALGWGQIQIKDTNVISTDTEQTRREWMLQLCDRLDFFYDAEISKIGERKKWFADIRKYWQEHH